MNIISSAAGGVHYSLLTEQQKRAVDDFYGRKLVDAEKQYHYFFNEDGECESAS